MGAKDARLECNMPTLIVVKNLRGTSKRRCACGSWIEHYYNHTTSRRTTCGVLGCGGDFDLGGHVYDLSGRRRQDWNHYIVPMCTPCNRTDDELVLKVGVRPVPANIKICTTYRR